MDTSLEAHLSTHSAAPGKIHFGIKMREELGFPLCPLKLGQKRQRTPGVSPQPGQGIVPSCPLAAPRRRTRHSPAPLPVPRGPQLSFLTGNAQTLRGGCFCGLANPQRRVNCTLHDWRLLPHVANLPEGNIGHNWKASGHIKQPPCCPLTAISQGASGLPCISEAQSYTRYSHPSENRTPTGKFTFTSSSSMHRSAERCEALGVGGRGPSVVSDRAHP